MDGRKLEDQFSKDLLDTVKNVMQKSVTEAIATSGAPPKDMSTKKALHKDKMDDCKKESAEVPFEGGHKVKTRKDKYGNVIKNVAKHLARKQMNKATTCEEVEINEDIQDIPDARIKYHATKNFPHGSYTAQQIKAEHDRRSKAVPNYHTVKASLGEETEELEEKRGLWDNIHAKRERIKRGSGERMRKPGSKGAPTDADFKAAQEEVQVNEVAPSGAKYERMVKHIKKAYAKDGKLTDKEKSIAYATAWKAKNEETEIEENWVVKKGTEVVSTHKSKDEADVKAMKHPLYKVVAKEEVELEEAALKSNKDGSSGSRGTTFSSSSPNSYKVVNNKGEHLADALNMKDPKYGGRTTHWHVTWHKERHKDHPTSFQYMHQLKKHVKGLDEEVEIEEAVGDVTVKKLSPDEAFKKHTGQNVKKTSTPVDPKTGKTLYQKVTSEEVEELEEGKMKDLVTKHMDSGLDYAAALKKAQKQLTKEEAEQIDELSKDTLKSYLDKKKVPSGTVVANANDPASMKKYTNRVVGGVRAAKRLMAKEELTQEEQDFIDELNAMDLDEARGRPKKYETNPNTKEKLHYDNPEHMKKIELLRKKGVLAKPSSEPGEHIINQLRKAATSITPHHVKFRNGQKHPISNQHAARALDKYASLKPHEKETFQHEIGRSHEDFKKHI